MTTQHTHSEHSDAEVTVVEHSHASETKTDTPQDAAVPIDSTHQPDIVDAGTPVEASFQDDQQHVAQEEIQEGEQKTDGGVVNQHQQDGADAETVEPYLDSSLGGNEEVRPFTDFIEEFRQAEARFSASLQDYQANALSLPTSPIEEVEVIHGEENYQPVLDTSVISSMDEAVASFAALPGGQVHETINGDVPVEPTATSQAAPSDTTVGDEEIQTPASNESEEGRPAVVPPTTRPVSPLLRPATPRGRVPRHGSRHHEMPATEKVTPSETQSSPQASQAAQTPTLTPQETPQVAQVEPVVSESSTVVEQPKPARRYRFDRPAPSTLPLTPPVTPAQTRVDESKEIADRGMTPVRPDSGQTPNGNGEVVENEIAAQQTKQTGSIPQQNMETTVSKQPVTQEPPVVEGTTASASPTTQEDRRRRHGQDRQRSKEQPTLSPVPVPSPVAEIVPAVPMPTTPAIQSNPVVAQGDEVAPEDLPPLEYSELQKASSRRRRRRHGSTVAGTTSTPLVPTPKVVTPATEQPTSSATALTPTSTPTPVSPAVPPRSAATPNAVPPVTPATPFSITSGYTVSQMNQHHEGKSPFMGPDPSPARGTTAAQNVRSIRTDAQRTPAYPVRTTEATSASVHQLANIVSQAIQTQTDRMVAELRRSNQGPTNISVSMPPFPSNERVGVFVDVANLLYSARTMRMTVDFGKLLDFLRGNRRLIRAQAYCPTSPQPGDEQMFLQAVKGLGYRITTKNYKTFSSGAKKADLDLDLCMDVVRLVDGRAVDCIVLVSGDSDFMPMLDYCSDHGVRVEVAAFDEAMSGTLRQSCDLFINLSMLEEIRA